MSIDIYFKDSFSYKPGNAHDPSVNVVDYEKEKMLFYFMKDQFMVSVAFILLSANAFKLDWMKILLFGKE